MPTISAHITDDQFDLVNEKAKKLFRSKRSSYIADLIERDLAGEAIEIAKSNENCFLDLADQFIDAEWEYHAAAALEKHKIPQSHFLGHILREASKALHDLSDGQDWHEIKCIIPASENSGPPKNPHLEDDVAAIEAQIERNAKTRKKAG